MQDVFGEVHGARDGAAGAIRPLRGRAVLSRDPHELGRDTVSAGGIIIPGSTYNERRDRIHRGRVLALGPPAYEHELLRIERPWLCEVGDEVLYVFAKALERVRGFEGIVVVAQEEIQAVVE